MDWPMVITSVSGRWRSLGTTRSGGQTLAGAEQIVVTEGAKWRAVLTSPRAQSDKSV